MVVYIEQRGGQVLMERRIKQSDLMPGEKNIEKLVLTDGTEVQADAYISTAPVDLLKLLMPDEWKSMDYFKGFQSLEGIPVINNHV